jgi:hypothetical protein
MLDAHEVSTAEMLGEGCALVPPPRRSRLFLHSAIVSTLASCVRQIGAVDGISPNHLRMGLPVLIKVWHLPRKLEESLWVERLQRAA